MTLCRRSWITCRYRFLKDGICQGKAVSPRCLGSGDAGRESVVVYDEYGPTRMVRTREWKYIHRYPEGPNELYDLANDPDERENRIGDAVQASRAGEMKTMMEDWFATYADPEKDGRERGVSGGRPTAAARRRPGESRRRVSREELTAG